MYSISGIRSAIKTKSQVIAAERGMSRLSVVTIRLFVLIADLIPDILYTKEFVKPRFLKTAILHESRFVNVFFYAPAEIFPSIVHDIKPM